MRIVAEGAVSAPVDLVEATGHGIVLHLTIQGEPFNVLTHDRTHLTPGGSLTLAFPEEHSISSTPRASGSSEARPAGDLALRGKGAPMGADFCDKPW